MLAGKHVAAQVGDAVVDGAPHLGRQRQHAAQHLAERRQVILRDPLGQCQQMLAEQRLLVEHCLEILAPRSPAERLTLTRRHHADELFVAERHDDARAALRRLALAHRIGEGAVQRHGQRDFAVGGHGGAISSLTDLPRVASGPGGTKRAEDEIIPP